MSRGLNSLSTASKSRYFLAFTVEGGTPYAVWMELKDSGEPLQVGDILESEGGELRIYKYVGFEEAHWVVPEIKTAPENLRSRKAIERLGAKYEGLFRNYMVYDEGTIHDRVIYSVIDKEWPEIRKRLENFLA